MKVKIVKDPLSAFRPKVRQRPEGRGLLGKRAAIDEAQEADGLNNFNLYLWSQFVVRPLNMGECIWLSSS